MSIGLSTPEMTDRAATLVGSHMNGLQAFESTCSRTKKETIPLALKAITAATMIKQ